MRKTHKKKMRKTHKKKMRKTILYILRYYLQLNLNY